MDPNCSLCTREKRTPQPYEDGICWTTFCSDHNEPMVVASDHVELPASEIVRHMALVANMLYPGRIWRVRGSMPEHFHMHAEGWKDTEVRDDSSEA